MGFEIHLGARLFPYFPFPSSSAFKNPSPQQKGLSWPLSVVLSGASEGRRRQALLRTADVVRIHLEGWRVPSGGPASLSLRDASRFVGPGGDGGDGEMVGRSGRVFGSFSSVRSD